MEDGGHDYAGVGSMVSDIVSVFSVVCSALFSVSVVSFWLFDKSWRFISTSSPCSFLKNDWEIYLIKNLTYYKVR